MYYALRASRGTRRVKWTSAMNATYSTLSSAGLPYRHSGVADSPQPFGAQWITSTLAGKKVVIVEDEGITQLQLKKALTKAGLEVVGVAGSGESGVEEVLHERPDIVLMDIKMPGAINGLEATRRILAEFSTCVVMLTAYECFQQEALRLGACGYITKPVDSFSLMPALLKAFNRFSPH